MWGDQSPTSPTSQVGIPCPCPTVACPTVPSPPNRPQVFQRSLLLAPPFAAAGFGLGLLTGHQPVGFASLFAPAGILFGVTLNVGEHVAKQVGPPSRFWSTAPQPSEVVPLGPALADMTC